MCQITYCLIGQVEGVWSRERMWIYNLPGGGREDLSEEGSIRGMHTGAVKGQEINMYTLISFCLICLDENIISAKMVATCLSNAGGAILHRIVG